MTVRRGIGQGFGFGIGCLLLAVAIVVGLIAMGSAAQKNATIGNPPAATNAPPSRILLQLADKGIQRTDRFTAGGDWRIDYAYDCASFGFDGNFIVTVYAADGSIVDVAVNELGKQGRGSQPEYRAGTFYLEVNSECAWNLGVAS